MVLRSVLASLEYGGIDRVVVRAGDGALGLSGGSHYNKVELLDTFCIACTPFYEVSDALPVEAADWGWSVV